MTNKFIRKINLNVAIFSSIFIFIVFAVFAANTNFQLTINPGTLVIDIVDDSYNSIPNPVFNFNEVSASMSCKNEVGLKISDLTAPSLTLGSSPSFCNDEGGCIFPGGQEYSFQDYIEGGHIYINNPDAADDGFTVSLASSFNNQSTFYNGDLSNITYNGSDCDIGNWVGGRVQGEVYGGRMYVWPQNGSIQTGLSNLEFSNISLGSNSYFDYDNVDSITLVQADANAEDLADYLVDGISVYQTIPAMVPAGNYSMDMTLSIIANGASSYGNSESCFNAGFMWCNLTCHDMNLYTTEESCINACGSFYWNGSSCLFLM